jgi:tetratricopeptide (TPR) repeat protein
MLPASAVEQLVEVARLAPGEMVARRLLLKVWRAEGRHDATAKTARELYDLGDRDVMTFYIVANHELRNANWDSAEKHIDELVGLVDPGRMNESLPIVQMLVRLHQGRGNVFRTQALLQETLDRVQQMTSVELQNLPSSHVESIGFLLHASCLDARDQQSLIDRCSVSLDVFDRLTPVRSTDQYAFETAEQAAILAGTLVAAFQHPTLPMQKEPQWQELLKRRQRLFLRSVEQVEPSLPSDELSLRGHQLLARVAFVANSDEHGFAIIQHGIATYESNVSADDELLLNLHLSAAERMIENHDFTAAAVHLDKLIASPTMAATGHFLAGLVAVRQGRMVHAREHLSQVTEESGRKLLARALMCSCDVSAENWSEVLSGLDVIEEAYPTLPPARQRWFDGIIGPALHRSLLRAQALSQTGAFGEAIDLLLTLEKSDARDPARLLRAQLLHNNGRTVEATSLLHKARFESPGSLPLLLAHVRLLAMSNNHQSAAHALRLFVSQTPDDVTARLALVNMLTTRLRNDDEASIVLGDVRRLRPDLKQGWYLAADIMIRQGQSYELRDLLSVLNRHDEVKHLVPLIQARAALAKAGLHEAEQVLGNATPESKETAEWQVTSGILALYSGDPERALALYAGALNDDELKDKARVGFLQALTQGLNSEDSAKTREQISKLLSSGLTNPLSLSHRFFWRSETRTFKPDIRVWNGSSNTVRTPPNWLSGTLDCCPLRGG